MTHPQRYRAFVGAQPLLLSTGANMLPEYSGWMDEQMSWKQTCYVGDWTFVPQMTVKGPDALRLFSDLSVNRLDNFPLERAKHCVQCNDDGKVISEGILIRHSEDEFDYQCGTPFWTAYNIKKSGYRAEVSFPRTYKLQVSGPNALQVLERVTDSDLRDVKFMWMKKGKVAGHEVTFLRQGMAGEIGFELQGPVEGRDEVYAAVVAAGEGLGMRKLGARSLPINHVEACYPTGGMHFFNALADDSKADYRRFIDETLPAEETPEPFRPMRYNCSTSFTGSWDGDDIRGLYRSPVEMGWSKSISFDHEFIGRAALEREVAHPQRVVVTLVFDPDDVLKLFASLFGDGPVYQPFGIPNQPYYMCWIDWILKDGKKVGHATQPIYSRFFRKALALSFIDVELSQPGTRVSVLWGNPGEPQMELRATVAPAPYKQTDRRADLRQQ